MRDSSAEYLLELYVGSVLRGLPVLLEIYLPATGTALARSGAARLGGCSLLIFRIVRQRTPGRCVCPGPLALWPESIGQSQVYLGKGACTAV